MDIDNGHTSNFNLVREEVTVQGVSDGQELLATRKEFVL